MDTKLRVVAFVDAMNLYHRAKDAFGYDRLNFDPIALAAAVAARQGWELVETRLYTGIPSAKAKPGLHRFWTDWIAKYRALGMTVVTRHVGWRQEVDAFGRIHYVLKSQKRIDIRIAFDMRTYAVEDRYDIALLFSQDEDFAEAAHEIKEMGRLLGRELRVASAFPRNERFPRGVSGTTWIPIDKEEYDGCLDLSEYGREG